MTSNINANNIDSAYPVAGQDNDSQGFRNNFTNIKNNFAYAKTELEDLQGKVILKAGLTGTTLDNNMAGALFKSAETRDLRETRYDFGTTSGSIVLDHGNGHYQTVSTGGTISLDFAGFPAAGKLGRIRLEITVTNVAHQLELPNSMYNTTGIAGMSFDFIITFAETGTYIFEFTTEDGGTSVHIADLSRPRDYFHSTQITLQQRTPPNIGEDGDTAGMIAVGPSYIYVCVGDYDGSTVIWKRSSLSSY